ncbi:hypothetical protein J4479_00075 [Candidatus Woesearchaeota archaeon]|nr:hypothetical protein [Candidatus Woesearchaeota archaeon]
MMRSKKGQGLSLNVIIIAALALIVLVVLAAIFIQQTGIFTSKLNKEANTELISLKGTYGECHPSRLAETSFIAAFSRAEPEDQEAARDALRETIRTCSFLDSPAACEANSDCDWQ